MTYRDRSLQELESYYRGAQPLNFLHPDLDDQARARLTSLVVNIPRIILDAIENRLDVDGFRLETAARSEQAWAIWQDNDLDVWSQQCHLDAMLYGRSFVMVWPDPDDPTRPVISVESAAQMAVDYDPTTRRIIRAAKQWKDGDEQYRTVYSPTRIERYVSDTAASEAEWRLRSDPIVNVYGAVPVFPFVNRPRLNRPMGESEILDVIPVADAVNKLATDMMVAAEFHAMPRRWATGIEVGKGPEGRERTRKELREFWSRAAADRVWTSDDHKSQFGQFTEASLTNFIEALRHFAITASALSGVPERYLGVTSDQPPSADAIRAQEASLVEKVKRKQRMFGGSWEQVMRLALQIADGGTAPEKRLQIETLWRNPATPAIAQMADAAQKLVAAEVIDPEQAREDIGYSPLQSQRIAERAAEREKDAAAKALPVAPLPPAPGADVPTDPTAPDAVPAPDVAPPAAA